jgi:hypothetical protein
MNWLKNHFNTGIKTAVSASAIMCFIQFMSSLYGVFRTGVFNGAIAEKLLSSFDGFETVFLFFVMLALNKKKP